MYSIEQVKAISFGGREVYRDMTSKELKETAGARYGRVPMSFRNIVTMSEHNDVGDSAVGATFLTPLLGLPVPILLAVNGLWVWLAPSLLLLPVAYFGVSAMMLAVENMQRANHFKKRESLHYLNTVRLFYADNSIVNNLKDAQTAILKIEENIKNHVGDTSLMKDALKDAISTFTAMMVTAEAISELKFSDKKADRSREELNLSAKEITSLAEHTSKLAGKDVDVSTSMLSQSRQTLATRNEFFQIEASREEAMQRFVAEELAELKK